MQERGSDSSHTDTPHPSCTAAGTFIAAQSPLRHFTPNYPRVCTSGGLPGTATPQLPPEQAGPASRPEPPLGPTRPEGITLALTTPHFCSGEETAGAGTQDEHGCLSCLSAYPSPPWAHQPPGAEAGGRLQQGPGSSPGPGFYTRPAGVGLAGTRPSESSGAAQGCREEGLWPEL